MVNTLPWRTVDERELTGSCCMLGYKLLHTLTCGTLLVSRYSGQVTAPQPKVTPYRSYAWFLCTQCIIFITVYIAAVLTRQSIFAFYFVAGV